MMLTRRDLDIIDFLEDYKIASTSTLRTLFFPSLSSCQKRLKTLYDNKKVKRARLTMNHDYIYYTKKPSQYMHSLLITEFYRELAKNTEVLSFKVQQKLGKIIPDSIFLYKINERQQIGLLEVEISHKGFDYDKYWEFYKSGEYKKWFPIMPTIYVVCKNAKIPEDTPLRFVKIKTDVSDFRL